AAPPYDQIDDAARARFRAPPPPQSVHLTRPVPADGLDMYRHPAALHSRWLASGVTARDPRPPLYPYVIELAGGGRRLGVCGLVGLDDPRIIRPHEQTLDKPLADRLALLRATRVDLEPILLLSEDGGRLDALLGEDLAGAKALADHRHADGNHHRLYRVEDPAHIADYKRLLDGHPSAIADGH